MLTLITVVNLRGVRDTGLVFVLPTYALVICLLGALAMGVWKAVGSGVFDALGKCSSGREPRPQV
jgi:hypothetical protein